MGTNYSVYVNSKYVATFGLGRGPNFYVEASKNKLVSLYEFKVCSVLWPKPEADFFI